MNTPAYIGTPLSSTVTRVMLPGAGEPGTEVFFVFQRPGEETIAVPVLP